jgi:TPR repeat protein
MKSRILLLLLILLLPFGLRTAQQNPDSKQDPCALLNRLKTMSPSEFMKLLAKAQAGDAAAQYQAGSAYEIGGPVSRDYDEAERWLLKSAEQRYTPPVEGVCVIRTPMIRGGEHPELIPDSVVYRSWFNQVGHALDDEAKMPGQVQAVLSMTHLSEADQAILKRIVLVWHQQEKQFVSTYNAKIEEANRTRDFTAYAIQVKFRHDHADLALATAKIAKESLSPEGARKFEQFIQDQKGAISMNEGVI